VPGPAAPAEPSRPPVPVDTAGAAVLTTCAHCWYNPQKFPSRAIEEPEPLDD
jgi:hypothetical protein